MKVLLLVLLVGLAACGPSVPPVEPAPVEPPAAPDPAPSPVPAPPPPAPTEPPPPPPPPAPAPPAPDPGDAPVPPKPPAPPPVAPPPRVCEADTDCFVYFRETRCNYSEPIAIPQAERRNARRLYPSSTANEMVGCAMPDLDDERRARARWTASCSPEGTCTLHDAGRGTKGPPGR